MYSNFLKPSYLKDEREAILGPYVTLLVGGGRM